LLLLLYCGVRESVTRNSGGMSAAMEWDEEVLWVWQQEYHVASGVAVWLGSGLSYDGTTWKQEIDYVASREPLPGDDACVVQLRFTVPCCATGHPMGTLEKHPTMAKQLLQYADFQKGISEARGRQAPGSPSGGPQFRWRLGIKECAINAAFTFSWLGWPQTALFGYFSQSEDADHGPLHVPVAIHLTDGSAGDTLSNMLASAPALHDNALAQLDRLEAIIAMTLAETPVLMRSAFKEIQVPDMRCGGYTTHCTNEVVFTSADAAGILRGHAARARNLRTYIATNSELLHLSLRPMVPWPALACLGVLGPT
jgi:hypothetical protein